MQEATGFQQMKGLALPEQEQLKCPRCESANTKFCYYNNYNLSQPRHFCKNCRRYWTKGGTLRNIPVGGGSRKNTKRSSPSSSSSANNPKRQPNPTPDPIRSQKLPDPSPPLTTSPTIPQQVVFNSGVQNLGSDTDPTRMFVLSVDHQDRKVMDVGGSFSSLLASSGQFENLLEGLNPNGSVMKTVQMGDIGGNLNSVRGMDQGSGRDRASEDGNNNNNNNGESYSSMQGGSGDTSCWTGGSNGWPDLAIYTPGLSFQ